MPLIIVDRDFVLTPEATERRLRFLRRTIDCGLHTGIPPCCVRWYVTRWIWLFSPNGARTSFVQRYLERMWPNDEFDRFGYIPCPACLRLGRGVETKACPPESECLYDREVEGPPEPGEQAG